MSEAYTENIVKAWLMLALLWDENCLSCSLYFIFGMWHNYWEFSRLWPRDSKYFQDKYCIYIWFYVGWQMSLEGILSGCVQGPSILWKVFSIFWFMNLLLSWKQSWRKNGYMKGIPGSSSLVMHPCLSVFQTSGPLVLLGCPQLPSNLLVCLDKTPW